ncbi:3855_t:CDS:1, partial [Ambispora leptoticha]
QMGVSDSTKPIYHGRDNEDIEEFLEDYEAYGASKDWDEDKMRQVIRLHVSDDLKPWIREQIKAKSTWVDLKAAIVSGAKASCDVEEKLERLKNIKQKSNDTIKAYTNKFDACAEVVKNNVRGLEKRQWYVQGLREPFRERVEMQCPETYDDAKKWALKVEKYSKDNEYVVRNPTRSINEESNITKSDVDDLASAFGALKICRVDQNQDQDDRIGKMESSIKELTKAILDLKENREPPLYRNQRTQNQRPGNQNQTIRSRRCYQCDQEGHLSRDCPTRAQQTLPDNQRNVTRNNQPDGPEVRGMNIRYLEVTESIKDEGDDYLRIKLEEGESLFDVRNLGKRRRVEDEHEMPSWAQKSTYNEIPEEIDQHKKGSIMYIPISELTAELDILKTIASLELPITLGQLFKWSPKARSEVLKALTRRKKESDVLLVNAEVRIVKGAQAGINLKLGNVPVSMVRINGEITEAPIDPGSRLNLMHESFARQKGLSWKPVTSKGRMADDRLSEFVGYIPNMKVVIEGIEVIQGFYVMKAASFEVLLGMPWLAAARCNLKWKNNKLWCTIGSDYKKASFIASVVPKDWINLSGYDDDDNEEDVDDIMAVRRIEIQEHEAGNEDRRQNERLKDIVKQASNSSKLIIKEIEAMDSRDLIKNSHFGQIIYWSRENEQADGTIRGLDMEPGVVMRLTKENCNELNIGDTISMETRKWIEEELMNKTPNVFAFDMSEIGKTNLIQYEVRTGGKEVPPMRVRPIRINNPEHAYMFECQLKDMIRYGLLEKGMGQYAYHCFPVKKKESGTDKLRVVGDMRPLNKHIIKDGYPLPIIRDILEKAVGHDWYSSVDAYKGYWQIQIRDEDKDKVAVATPLGVLRYTVMCMGLKNASETFQRLMDKLLEGDEWRHIAAAYQDDIGLWTQGTIEEHVDKFVKLAQTFSNAGLTFAAKKCHLLYKELNMYGFIVGKEGIKPDPTRIKKINEWKAPENVRDVRVFLGTMNYYRRFVKNFSAIAKPLTELTKKDVKFKWTGEEVEAFQLLKHKMIHDVMLKGPNWQDAKNGSKPYQMSTDACDTALGVVLEQVDDQNKLRPVTFESRKLNSHEVNYTVTERECLGVVFGCNMCERYVAGTMFDVWVDHQALEWLFNKALLKGRLMRWVIALQTFDFKVHYKPGKKHGHADGLSRYPEPVAPGNRPLDEIYVDSLLLRVDNETDRSIKDLGLVKYYLENMRWPLGVLKEDLPRLQSKIRKFCLINGQLFRRSGAGKPPRRVLLNDDEKVEIMKANHEGLAGEGGHRGIKGTVRKILLNYVWGNGNIYSDVKNYVSSCLVCQMCASKQLKEPIHVIATSWIFHKLYVDCIGPLPRTSAGHEHIVVAVEDLTGYIEARALRSKNAKSIATFLWEEIITRHGCFAELTSDRGTEFKNNIMEELTARLQVKQQFTASYHPEANGRAERTVQKLTRIIRKVSAEAQNRWHEHLRAAIWALNVTVSELGYSPFRLIYGRDAIMPVELTLESYQVFMAKQGWNTDELLAFRTLQIKGLVTELKEAKANRDELHERWKKFHDRHANENKEKIEIGDLVLVYDSTLDNTPRKLDYRWVGPYVVRRVGQNGHLYLNEMDGSELKDPFTRNRVKRLKQREAWIDESHSEGCVDFEDEDLGGSSSCRAVDQYPVYYVRGMLDVIGLDFDRELCSRYHVTT